MIQPSQSVVCVDVEVLHLVDNSSERIQIKRSSPEPLLFQFYPWVKDRGFCTVKEREVCFHGVSTKQCLFTQISAHRITQRGKLTSHRITCNDMMIGQAPKLQFLLLWFGVIDLCYIASLCRCCREHAPEQNAPTCSCSPAMFVVHLCIIFVMY